MYKDTVLHSHVYQDMNVTCINNCLTFAGKSSHENYGHKGIAFLVHVIST